MTRALAAACSMGALIAGAASKITSAMIRRCLALFAVLVAAAPAAAQSRHREIGQLTAQLLRERIIVEAIADQEGPFRGVGLRSMGSISGGRAITMAPDAAERAARMIDSLLAVKVVVAKGDHVTLPLHFAPTSTGVLYITREIAPEGESLSIGLTDTRSVMSTGIVVLSQSEAAPLTTFLRQAAAVARTLPLPLDSVAHR